MAKAHKFPRPADVAAKFDSCFRDNAAVLALYNEALAGGEAPATLMGKKVRAWVRVTAAQHGWAEVVFPTNYENPGEYIGAVFIRAAGEE